MPKYHVQIMSLEPGPSVGGPIGSAEGDGARAVKEAASQIGAVVTGVQNLPSPLIYPTPYFYIVETTEPLNPETLKERLEAVWNASKTEVERKPFPQATGTAIGISEIEED